MKARAAVVAMHKVTHVLTTVVTARGVHQHAARAQRAVAHPVGLKVAKTVVAKMAMNCHATLIRSKPHSLRVWICPTASPCATVVSPTRHAPASTAWPSVAAALVAVVAVAAEVAAMAGATAVAKGAEAVASAADQRPAL